MTAKERVLSCRLLERISLSPGYGESIGISCRTCRRRPGTKAKAKISENGSGLSAEPPYINV